MINLSRNINRKVLGHINACAVGCHEVKIARKVAESGGVLHCAAASETCLAKFVCVARYVTCNFLGNLSGNAVARHIAEKLHNVTADLDGTTLAYNCFMRRFFLHTTCVISKSYTTLLV